jgi:hypothetical protein
MLRFCLYSSCTLSPANEEDAECDKNISGNTADSGGTINTINSSSSTAEQAISEQLDAAKDRRQHLQQQQQQQAHNTASTDTDTDTHTDTHQQRQEQQEQQKDVDQPLEDVDDDECDVADDVSCSGESPTDSSTTTATNTVTAGGSAGGSAMAAAQSEVQGEHATAKHSGGPYYHMLVVTVLSLQLPATADSSVSTTSTAAADQVRAATHVITFVSLLYVHASV